MSGAIKLTCPKCKHILGSTTDSFDGEINCRWCKAPAKMKLVVAKVADYLPEINKEEKK